MNDESDLAEVPALLHRAAAPVRVRLLEWQEDGLLRVSAPSGEPFVCEWLESVALQAQDWRPGDHLLALPPSALEPGCVLGRIRRGPAGSAAQQVTLQARDRLTLRCGESSLEMHADGKVLLKGDDVLLRAKGTQRIRAGTVAIN